MTNPNDLISRKEIEKMIGKVRESDDPYSDLPDYRNNPTAALQELLQKFKS